MHKLLFVLGRTPELAFFELTQLFGNVTRISASFVILDHTPPDETPETLLHIVGGTTKIGEYLGPVNALDAKTLITLLDESQSQVVFAVSTYDGCVLPKGLLQEMKKALKEKGTTSRYIETGDTSILSSVVFAKEDVQELLVSKNTQGYVLGKVRAVQPFEDWNTRDYSRPYADAKLGMLPPKVSRMAVNIALGKTAYGKTVLDPFCGMGTILAEALLRGARVVGSDQSEDVIHKAHANLEWLIKTYKLKPDMFTLTTRDATHVSEHIQHESIEAIITEPFMGDTEVGLVKARFTQEKIKNVIKGLEKLYIGCLKDWHMVLKPGGTVLMALPEYSYEGRTFFVKKVIDSCENFGYTIAAGPIEYSRPHAVVKREFYLFTKKKMNT